VLQRCLKIGGVVEDVGVRCLKIGGVVEDVGVRRDEVKIGDLES